MKYLIPTLLLVIIIVSASFTLRAFANQTSLPGISVDDIAIGGMSYDDGVILLEEKITPFLEESFAIEYNQEKLETSLNALGVTFNGLKTIESAYEISLGENTLDHIKNRISALIDPITINPAFEIDRSQLDLEIKRLIPGIQDAKPASLIADEDNIVKIVEQEKGKTVDFDSLVNVIEASLLKLELPKISIETVSLHPAYTEESASKDAEILQSILNQEIHLTHYQNGDLSYEHKLFLPPEWVAVKNQSLEFKVGPMQDYLEQNIAVHINKVKEDAIIESATTEQGGYAEVVGVARDGVALNVEETAQKLVTNLNKGDYKVGLVVDILPSRVVNNSNLDLGDMTLLGIGRSNFEGSPEGRDFNVRKGLNEKVNNVLLAPGEIYSYNSRLGPVTHSAGWKDSLAIFGGRDLIPVPGGGLCQTSTTVYRAILNSGLKLVEKSNHSLYVHYYKQYGDGLDAAIYPGSKDLRFMNDTDNYLLIQAYDDGFDGYVKIYGTPDGRSVELIGPFYEGRVPPEYQDTVRPRWNQIVWIQKITRSNGEVEEELLVSTYRTAPR